MNCRVRVGYVVGWCLPFLLCWSLASKAAAQHEHDSTTAKAPRVFLDKSLRVVEYQLGRLTNEQLRLVETQTDDVKYLPVFRAILSREGMSRSEREQALAGMVAINGSNVVQELTGTMNSLKRTSDGSSDRTLQDLSTLLLQQPVPLLHKSLAELSALTESGDSMIASVGYAAQFAAGRATETWTQAESPEQQSALLDGISLVPDTAIRASQHASAFSLLDSPSLAVRQAALRALSKIPANQSQTFERATELWSEDSLRPGVVRTLLSVPIAQRSPASVRELVALLVDYAESTPAKDRTSDTFLDAMQLVDELLAAAPSDFAKPYRARLRETVVRVVRIHTVEEEMRYDVPYFAVEAGRPVQVVLVNDDLMPHNLVITQPGALQQVAESGASVTAEDGFEGKPYVPNSEQVLFATDMIATWTQERLTFTAPSEPGEYPYVCTFPRHWMRMYGVMVVVEDLDAWQKNPVEPQDPIGSNRSFVQNWTVSDLPADLSSGLRGRSPAIGERIFTEATCAQCHKAGNVGVGNVGPSLAETFAKYQGDVLAVLREILDPSHRIDEKYAVHLILDLDGKAYSGLVVEEDADKVVLLENPEAAAPTTILRDDIDRIVKTSTSMMPKGLMDRFSQDEIFELLGFLQSIQQ